MKRKVLLTTFVLFLCIIGIYAQPDPDCPPYPAADGCGFADPDCENGLDGYCSTLMPQDQITENIPGCGGSAVLNNDDWIAFYAGTTTITVVITPSNCQSGGGNQGIQAGFYAACDDLGGVNMDGLASQPLSLQCGCTTGPVTLDFNNFVVGQTYYIMIDGCGGDICDYVINVTQGSTVPSPPLNPSQITGPTTICPGAIVSYSTDAIFGIPYFVWTVVGGTIIGNPNANPVQVQWNSSGSISVYGENDCFTTESVSLDVNVEVPPPGNDEGEYCAGSQYIYPGNGNPYTAGTYDIDFPGAGNLGCDSSVNLVVIEHPTPFIDIIETICEGEEIIVGGVPYNTTGNWNIVLETSFGCDSTIYLDLTVLDPYSFVLEPDPITCTVEQVVINGGLSMGDAYEWYTFDGCIEGATNFPTVTASCEGTYCLIVTSFGMNQGNQVECTEEFCMDVIEDNNGPDLEVDGTDVLCESNDDGTATVTVTGGAPAPFIYVWNTTPIQPTQTATGLSGGTYCVTVTSIGNGCTSEACYNVSAPPAIGIDIVSDDILCNGEDSGSATAIADGGAGGFSFAWDTNPIETTATINGLSAGTYTVTVTDANECTEESSVVITEPAAFDVNLSTNDALCNGGSSGSATISVSGGAGLLTYLWSPGGQDTDTAVNLTAGDYTVLVTDENGCTVEETVTITEPPAITLQTSNTETSCNNTPDGSATVMPSGGTGGYTYLWTPGNQETPTADNLTSGDYTVVVTDDNDCTATAIVTVSSPNGMTVNPSFTNASCNGGADGSATVTTSGGTPDYQYTWDTSPVQITPTATGLSAGTYNVTIEDMNGCEEYETFVITEPTAVTLSSTTTDALCNEDANGSATVTPSGGTGDYDYEWDTTPEQITATATGLGAGSYTVLVTDDNGCTATETVMISEPAVLSLTTNQTDALCNQSADGTATVAPSGGTGPYSYAWTGGQVDATAIDLLAGNYTVIVEDANGCTEEASVIIEEPEALALSLTGVDPDCNQSLNGTATVTPSGGTGAYTYLWDDGQTTSTATGLDGGTIGVVVTDANGCSETESINLIAPPALSLMTSQENILCFGEETGTAMVTPNGGTGPYTYQWDDNASQNTATAINLAAGTYTPTVTDANDCTAEITVDLTEPTAALAATGTSTDALCGQDDGTIDLTVTGGTPPYTYEWSNNDTNQDPQNLGPGTYSVVITDANGCTFTTSVQVSTPSGLEALVSVTDANCNGESNGQVDITVNGGVTPYDYQWSDPTYNGQQDLVDVLAGNYMLTLTDADGCTVTASAIVGQPALLTGTATPSQASCGGSDGSISLVVSGGTTPYGFEWENDVTGETYPNQSPNGLPQGNYTGVVTDDNGCSITLTASVTVPDGPVANISAVNLSCFEDNSGSIEVTVVGGDTPYTYEWNDAAYNGQEDLSDIPAGIWEVLITDDNSCSTTVMIEVTQPELLEVSATMTPVICFGENSGTVSAIATGGTGISTFVWDVDPNAAQAGIYNVVATDENGCTAETSVEVTEPAELMATATAIDVDCNGASTGSLLSNVTGGTGPYSYAWSGGLTDANPIDVPANIYTLIVTDFNGCTIFAQTEVEEPEILNASSTFVESTCGEANGSINLTVTGGVSPYSYLWSNTDTNEDPQDLVPGNYIVTVTDANDCTTVYGQTVTTPSALGISGTGADVACYEGSDGSTNITVTGGTPPFSYLWDDPANQTLEDAVNLTAGTYTVTVTDDNGCTISTSIIISEPPPFEATSLGATSVSCNGGNDGSIVITVSGGTAPYLSYQWDNTTQMIPDPDGLSAGSYTLTVTDSQGCTAVSETITIVEPDAMILTTSTVAAACNGSSDGSIELTVMGGTEPYTYNWNGGTYVDEDPANIPAGQYTVIVTDAEGCTQTTATTVDQPQALEIVIDNVSNYGGYNVTCWNTTDGTAEAIASGGTEPFSYAWSNGMNTGQIDDLAPGTYMVTVTDAEGCTNTNQVSLTAPQEIVATAAAVAADCYGESDGQVIVTSVSGGAAPYMYSIGASLSPVNQFVNLPAGEYDVTVEDVNGCQWTTMVEVTEPEEFVVDLGEDEEILLGDSVQLLPLLYPGGSVVDTFVWKEREVIEFEPWVTPTETQTYSIVVTNQSGCKAEDIILVRVKKERLVYIPNTFTPNNDGFNDIFWIQTGRGVASLNNFRIFSRWGELVYEHLNPQVGITYADPENGWDGKLNGEPMNPGVFVYVVEVTFIDGRVEIYKGDVTLKK